MPGKAQPNLPALLSGDHVSDPQSKDQARKLLGWVEAEPGLGPLPELGPGRAALVARFPEVDLFPIPYC